MHDSHAHLSHTPLRENLIEVLKTFKAKGGKYVLNVALDYETMNEVIAQAVEAETLFPQTVFSSLGIHPDHISSLTSNFLYKEVDKGIAYLEETIISHKNRVLAVGETGLDYFHLYNRIDMGEEERESLIEAQKYSFRKHVEIAVTHDLPLTIHTRDAKGSTNCTADALKILATSGKGKARGVFHSYTGEPQYLSDIIAMGFMVGFNGIITYPNAQNVRDLLKQTPIDKILTETDSPFLPPQSIRKYKSKEEKYSQPADVREILDVLIKTKDMESDQLEAQLNQNFEALFLGN